MKYPLVIALVAIAFLCPPAFDLGQPNPVQAQPTKTPGKGIDAATVADYEKLGAVYGGWQEGDICFLAGHANAEKGLPAFRFNKSPKAKLPDVAVPFGLDLGNSGLTDAGLTELAALTKLEALGLRANPITDAGLKELAPLKNLGSLYLDFTKVTDAGLKELAGFAKLSSLRLGDTAVTDAGLKELTPLKNLNFLLLYDSKVTSTGLKALAPLKNLTSLYTTLDDNAVRALSEIGLLHAIPNTYGIKGRPKSDDEVRSVDFSHTKVTGAGLKEVVVFKNLKTLYLGNEQYSAEGLRVLRELGLLHLLWLNATGESPGSMNPKSDDDIVELNFGLCPVTDAGLKELASLKSLTFLNLSNTNVTDAGLKELAAFKTLTSLRLTYTDVTDAGLKDLAGCAQLSLLDLSNTKVTDAGLKDLAGIAKLSSLDLSYTKITGAGLKELAAVKKLAKLRLVSTKTKLAEAKELVALKNLTSLDLGSLNDAKLRTLRELGLLHVLANAKGKDGARPKSPEEVVSLDLSVCGVTDAGLKELAGLKNLTNLNLYMTLTTDAGVEELQKALPNCKIHRPK